MGAETYDVDLGHSGQKIARKPGEQEGLGFALGIEKFAKSSGWMEHCAQARALERPINMTALVAIYDLKPRIAIFRL
jgi:hypothetical protein